MHFDLHQIRSRELICEADEYRLARQARRVKLAPHTRATRTLRPARGACCLGSAAEHHAVCG